MSQSNMNQRGAVSIITVVIFATIITIVIGVYARITVGQQRESVTYDLGTRAYFAAESGVQDAIRAINAGEVAARNENFCTPLKDGSGVDASGKFDTNGNRGYSCQLISTNPVDITGKLNPQIAQMVIEPKSPDPGNYSLEISWSPYDTQLGGNILVPRPSASKLFPTLSAWSNSSARQTHPLLRVAAIQHPQGTFSSDQIAQSVFFLNPTPTADAAPTITNNQSAESVITNASCQDASQASPDYGCKQTINISGTTFFSTNKLYLRLASIYGSTKFQVVLKKGTDRVALVNSQAQVDVTGYAGDVLRRVRQKVPVGFGYLEDLSLDAALVGGEKICKNFAITATAAEFRPDCNPAAENPAPTP